MVIEPNVTLMKPDFFLTSSEGYNLESPRKCYEIKRLYSDSRDDYMLIRVEPSLMGNNMG
jgi:hypothetical protein